MEQVKSYSHKVNSKLAKNLFRGKVKLGLMESSLDWTRNMILSVDQQFFITSAVIITLFQIPALLLSLFEITNKLADPAFVLSFIGVALTTLLLQGTYYLRQIVVSSMVTLWGLRLGSFLAYRSFYSKDWRLEEVMKSSSSIFSFYLFQAILIWTTCLPVILLNSSTDNPAIGLNDMLGYAVWGAGFLMETVADWQKYQFHKSYKERFCNIGLWRHSRHPNFFGEVLQWWGVFLCVSPLLHGWNWALGLMGPLSMMISILFISGIPPLERKSNLRFGKDTAYQRYIANVPVFFPSLSCELVSEAREKLKKSE